MKINVLNLLLENEKEIEVFQSVLERITEKAKLYMESREESGRWEH